MLHDRNATTPHYDKSGMRQVRDNALSQLVLDRITGFQHAGIAEKTQRRDPLLRYIHFIVCCDHTFAAMPPCLTRFPMPSIFAVANPKGGSGKTTVAIILAGEFARHGYSAAIIDADPQGSSYQWHASSVARGVSPDGIDLVRAPDANALAQAIERLDAYDVVVIDTPGYYGEALIQSALRADLVVLPCKAHTFDASQVVRTIRNLERHAAESNLPMSQHRVLLNEYDSLDRNTRPLREVLAYFNAEGVPVCANTLYRRVTYRSMTSGYGTLYQMNDKDESIRKARYNADQVVRELLAASQGAKTDGAAA
ncbi:ParA family protein (plasmid) [Bradyrhizobium sp. CCGUVB23]|nr:ParA family protein [Bradyrhizobium sp. CCGUVB23]MCP3468593.1 ParA family protein [Bradyrhizobium sp. CCGUVB23]